ncbi:MAG: NAD(P)H-binding protein [Pseudomonadota bacterium]
MFGATGTIGQAVAQVLVERQYDVTCFLRPEADEGILPEGVEVRRGHVTNMTSLMDDGYRDEVFDYVVSCMASRTGVAHDAWAVDYAAHMNVLSAAKSAGAAHFVFLSAMCVQKPVLAFQKAKLAFEEALIGSGLTYSIIRPTAFFKSLSGQIERVMAGKSFLLFGDGEGTACKPISDRDLAVFMADSLRQPDRRNRILPIGGPGPAMTPREQGARLFELLGKDPKFSEVPLAFMTAMIWGLNAAGTVVPALRTKAELARIGRYYATESMLVLDPETGEYAPGLTPSTGTEMLFDYYRQLIGEGGRLERGAHKVF